MNKSTLKKIVIVFLLVFLMNSCNDNSIGGHYELDYSPMNEICLLNKQKSGMGYDLISIKGHILFYGYSKDYIILIEKPSDSIYNHNENLNNSSMEKKIFESSFTQFWILKIKEDTLFGPFQKIQYLKKRKEIGIPDNLKINYSTKRFYYGNQRTDVQYENPDGEVVDIKNLTGN